MTPRLPDAPCPFYPAAKPLSAATPVARATPDPDVSSSPARPLGTPTVPTSRGSAEERAAGGGAVVPGRELHAVADGYAASRDGPAGSLAAAAAPRHVSCEPPTTLLQPRGTSAQPFSCPARPFRLGSTPLRLAVRLSPPSSSPAACKWFPAADLGN